MADPPAHQTSCSTRYDNLNETTDTFCSKPLRGAAGMDDDKSGTECSIGGVAFQGATAYVVTAGHCLAVNWATTGAPSNPHR